MRNRGGRFADNETGPCHSQMRHYSADHPVPERRLTSPPATTAGACGRTRAWCRWFAANRRPPASRHTVPAVRRDRCDATASGRREWPSTPDRRSRDCPLPQGPRGILRAFRESRPIVPLRSRPVPSFAAPSFAAASLAHSLQAMARNARRARRFENERLSGRHPFRSPIRPSPDTVLTAGIRRKNADRQPVEVVVRPRFCQV